MLNTSEIKNILGFIAITLTFVGYIPYVRDVIKGKTKPHIYSWFLWGFVTLIAFSLQVTSGGGTGSYVTLIAGLMCIIVFILSLFTKGKKDITSSDTIFFIMAMTSLLIWLIAKQPLLSIVLVTLTDLLGFIPTIRKSWNNPQSETLSFYTLNSFRFLLAIIALSTYSLKTTLYPTVWLLGNGLFALMLIIRRIKLNKNK